MYLASLNLYYDTMNAEPWIEEFIYVRRQLAAGNNSSCSLRQLGGDELWQTSRDVLPHLEWVLRQLYPII